jgi:hypothetical protein
MANLLVTRRPFPGAATLPGPSHLIPKSFMANIVYNQDEYPITIIDLDDNSVFDSVAIGFSSIYALARIISRAYSCCHCAWRANQKSNNRRRYPTATADGESGTQRQCRFCLSLWLLPSLSLQASTLDFGNVKEILIYIVNYYF